MKFTSAIFLVAIIAVFACSQVAASNLCAAATYTGPTSPAFGMTGPPPAWNTYPKNHPNSAKHYALSYHQHKVDIYYYPNLASLAVTFAPGPSVKPIVAAVTTKTYNGGVGAQRLQLDGNTPCDVLMNDVGDLDTVNLYST